MRGIGKPAEVAVGTSPQGFFGNRRLILKRLQLRDFVEQTGKVAVLNAGDLRTIIQIGTRRSAGQQCRDQRDDQKKTSNPHPTPKGNGN